jgi:hypothetical protein
MSRKTPKCNIGFPCGKTCISRNRSCWANLSLNESRLAETFSQFVNRIVGIGNNNQSELNIPIESISTKKSLKELKKSDPEIYKKSHSEVLRVGRDLWKNNKPHGNLWGENIIYNAGDNSVEFINPDTNYKKNTSEIRKLIRGDLDNLSIYLPLKDNRYSIDIEQELIKELTGGKIKDYNTFSKSVDDDTFQKYLDYYLLERFNIDLGYSKKDLELSTNTTGENKSKAPLRDDLAELEKESTKNLSDNEINKVKENLNVILSGRNVAMNFFEDSLEALLDSKGKFMNQFEIGESMGEYNPELRMEIEERTNGLSENTPPSERPKYGHLINDNYQADNMNYEAFNYGAIRFIFNESIKDKVTYTFGDSLFNEESIANSLEKPSLGVFTEQQLKKLASLNPEDLKNLSHQELQKILENALRIDVAYIEAQIHGSLTLDDVASVDIPSFMANSPEVEKLRQEYPNIKINFFKI